MQQISNAIVEMQIQERAMLLEKFHQVDVSNVGCQPATDQCAFADNEMEHAADNHTRARGSELRSFNNEIDELAADLIALEDEIQVACSV
jgi:hypothetical protein